MSYRIAAQKAFDRERRKMVKKNRPLDQVLAQAMERVMDDPSIGEPYHGNLYGLMDFKFDPTDATRPYYRLVYAHYSCCELPDDCKYADAPLEEGETTCSGMIEFVSVANRKDAEALYKKDASYISSRLRS